MLQLGDRWRILLPEIFSSPEDVQFRSSQVNLPWATFAGRAVSCIHSFPQVLMASGAVLAAMCLIHCHVELTACPGQHVWADMSNVAVAHSLSVMIMHCRRGMPGRLGYDLSDMSNVLASRCPGPCTAQRPLQPACSPGATALSTLAAHPVMMIRCCAFISSVLPTRSTRLPSFPRW